MLKCTDNENFKNNKVKESNKNKAKQVNSVEQNFEQISIACKKFNKEFKRKHFDK